MLFRSHMSVSNLCHFPNQLIFSLDPSPITFWCSTRPSAADGYNGFIISISTNTDQAIDQFNLPHHVIPQLHVLGGAIQSSKWQVTLQGPGWGLTPEQAISVSRVMIADFTGDTGIIQHQKVCPSIQNCTCS